MNTNESFALLMSQLRQGDQAAAARIFEVYTGRLIRQAQAWMSGRLQAKGDPEDIVQSVYRSFFRRQRAGQFRFDHAGGLWSLLALMTARKCKRWNEHFKTARRDGRRERYIPALQSDESTLAWEAPGADPTPYEVAAVADLVERVMRSLQTDTQRQILKLRLQGYSYQEIGAKVERSEQTVSRVLTTVREYLKAALSTP